MIDIENEVFSKIAAELRSRFPKIQVIGEDARTDSPFPCASIVEIDNYTLRRTQDSRGNEHHAHITYEVNVYSNRTAGKKTECKKIYAAIDDVLIGLGFTRTLRQPVGMDDATIYRMVGRYTAIVSENKTIYNRR